MKNPVNGTDYGNQDLKLGNSDIISMANPSSTGRDRQLIEIGRSGKLVIAYDVAKRSPLVRW